MRATRLAVLVLAASTAVIALAGVAPAQAAAPARASAPAKPAAFGFSFLTHDGRPSTRGKVAEWLLPFLSVEICPWHGSSCRIVAGRLGAAGSVRITARGTAAATFRAAVDPKAAHLKDGGRYRVCIVAGAATLGCRPLLVRAGGPKRGVASYVVRPNKNLAVGFRILDRPWAHLPALTAEPGRAQVGTVFGLRAQPRLATAKEPLQLFAAGEPAPVTLAGPSRFTAGVPLFLDRVTRFPAPPAAPVDLVLFSHGVPVAVGRKALTAAPLARAPGSTARARQTLDGIAVALASIGRLAAPEKGAQQQWMTSVTAALSTFLNGNDPRSLKSHLAGVDPAELGVLDAQIAGSGLLDALRRYEKLVADLAASMNGGPQTASVHRASSTSYPTDVQLAREMQLYEIVKLFGDTVIQPTSQTWGLIVGTAVGLAQASVPFGGLQIHASAEVQLNGRAVGLVQWVGIALSVLDFTVNKIVVGLLPSRITEFQLTLAVTQLSSNETTDALLRVSAVNDPPPIGVQDIIEQLLNGLTVVGAVNQSGAAAIQMATIATLVKEAARKKLTDAANFIVQTIRSGISAYSNGCPECHLDTTVISMPALAWQANVTDTRLVERRTNNASLIEGRADDVNWKTHQSISGATSVFAHTAFGPEVAFLSVPASFGYTPGAFGVNNDTTTNLVPVHIEAPPAIHVTIAPRPVDVSVDSLEQFTAAVTGTQNTAVTWSTNCGSINQSQGLYTAPRSPGICAVTATSAADPAASDTVTFNVKSLLTVTPATATLAPGTTQQFTASAAVTWTSTCGAITPTGLYTAPTSSGSRPCTVTATTVAAPAASVDVSVTIGIAAISWGSSHAYGDGGGYCTPAVPAEGTYHLFEFHGALPGNTSWILTCRAYDGANGDGPRAQMSFAAHDTLGAQRLEVKVDVAGTADAATRGDESLRVDSDYAAVFTTLRPMHYTIERTGWLTVGVASLAVRLQSEGFVGNVYDILQSQAGTIERGSPSGTLPAGRWQFLAQSFTGNLVNSSSSILAGGVTITLD